MVVLSGTESSVISTPATEEVRKFLFLRIILEVKSPGRSDIL